MSEASPIQCSPGFVRSAKRFHRPGGVQRSGRGVQRSDADHSAHRADPGGSPVIPGNRSLAGGRRVSISTRAGRSRPHDPSHAGSSSTPAVASGSAAIRLPDGRGGGAGERPDGAREGPPVIPSRGPLRRGTPSLEWDVRARPRSPIAGAPSPPPSTLSHTQISGDLASTKTQREDRTGPADPSRSFRDGPSGARRGASERVVQTYLGHRRRPPCGGHSPVQPARTVTAPEPLQALGRMVPRGRETLRPPTRSALHQDSNAGCRRRLEGVSVGLDPVRSDAHDGTSGPPQPRPSGLIRGLARGCGDPTDRSFAAIRMLRSWRSRPSQTTSASVRQVPARTISRPRR